MRLHLLWFVILSYFCFSVSPAHTELIKGWLYYFGPAGVLPLSICYIAEGTSCYITFMDRARVLLKKGADKFVNLNVSIGKIRLL